MTFIGPIAALRALIESASAYAYAPEHAVPRGTRTRVQRDIALARRLLDGDQAATCGQQHKGFICARPRYHSGKHRHSEKP
jgi:hypothetical protein